MASNYYTKQQISYDLASKDFISVDIGTSSTPNVLQIPVFKNNTQFKFINDGQTVYAPENLYYMDTYSQRWNNAPNVITMFIQDAVAIGVKPDGEGGYTKVFDGKLTQPQRDLINEALFNYFSSNSGPIIYTGSPTMYIRVANSVSSITSGTNLTTGAYSKLNYYIAKGNESSGTLSNFFKRPTDEELNPTGILNLAQGNYPYNIENIITSYEVNRWVGEWGQFIGDTLTGSTTSAIRAPGFDLNNGVYIDVINLNNEPFGSSFSSETNVSIPRFYEPIDYYFSHCAYNNTSEFAIYALYRRVYFGVQPFNL